MSPASLGTARPSPGHERLLQAILGDGEPALAAWRQWRQRVALEDVDEGSFRLLPLAFVRCGAYEADPATLQRLKGVHRQSWYRNRIVRRRAREVVTALADSGIPTLVLKGLAVGDLYYPDGGARPMVDADILVPEAAASGAAPVLARLGLRPLGPWPPVCGQSVDFVAHQGPGVDLHLHVLQECVWRGADAGFWERSEPFDLDGVATRTLAPTDQLFHVVLHGLRFCPVPPVRWVPDALLLLRRDGPRVEWDRLVALAKAWRLLWTLGAGLGYLARTHAAPVPAEVLTQASAWHPSLQERFDHWARLRRPGLWGELPRLWSEYRRLQGPDGPPPAASGFPGFLGQVWQADGHRGFAALVARKAVRRSRASLGRLLGRNPPGPDQPPA